MPDFLWDSGIGTATIIWQDAPICEFFHAFGLDETSNFRLIERLNKPVACRQTQTAEAEITCV